MWTPKKIRRLRLRLGLSQAEFAMRIGASVNTVIAWEQPVQREGGEANPRHRTPSGMAAKSLESLAVEVKNQRE